MYTLVQRNYIFSEAPGKILLLGGGGGGGTVLLFRLFPLEGIIEGRHMHENDLYVSGDSGWPLAVTPQPADADGSGVSIAIVIM
jgi:hypothetical protein